MIMASHDSALPSWWSSPINCLSQHSACREKNESHMLPTTPSHVTISHGPIHVSLACLLQGFSSIFLLLLLAICCPPAQGSSSEAFSALASLRNLAAKQDKLLDRVETYLDSEFKRLASIKETIAARRRAVEEFQQDPQEALQELDHPVTAYQLVRDWSHINDQIGDSSAAQVALTGSDPLFPSMNDRLGALRALLRLQRVYNISTSNMVMGEMSGHTAKVGLTSRDCYDLGTMAASVADYLTSSKWLLEAKRLGSTEVPEQDINYRLAQAYHAMYDFSTATEYALQAYDSDTSNMTTWLLLDAYRKLNETEFQFHKTYLYHQPHWRIGYEALCRGEYIEGGPRSSSPNSFCTYQVRRVLYAPYKLEVLNQDPWIVIYHDVISDREAAILKELATPQLDRSVVGDPAKSFATEQRISKVTVNISECCDKGSVVFCGSAGASLDRKEIMKEIMGICYGRAWLWDEHSLNETVRRLTRRVQEVTGLSTSYASTFSNAEPFQVVNYGMGGQYEPHVDVYENIDHLANVPDFIKGTGDRIATFMFYLTDVTKGGATVFPIVNAYVPATKNAAAFWYNIHRNGELDMRTQHAGCPVLIGEKWVANKWIRERGQIFRRPCCSRSNATEVDCFV